MEGQLDTTGSNCKACDRSDSADAHMVACDSCHLWEHFACAGVDESVRDRKYVCKDCTAKVAGSKTKRSKNLTADNRSTKTAGGRSAKKGQKNPSIPASQTSSARAAVLDAQMRVLEEEKAMKEQELREQEELQRRELEEEQRQIEEKRQLMEEERRLRQRKLEEQRAILAKQHMIRRESLEKKSELIKMMSEGGSTTSSIPDSQEKVKSWLADQQQTHGRSLGKTAQEQEAKPDS
ncbi:uncharacterized protein LOC134286843 [Aedes albopictus]|uniref:PHD-type domain-containing protein n=1 Tax=Aedes albopictus TaxID=7160 RepID=A0ABM1Z1P0_AEDAL